MDYVNGELAEWFNARLLKSRGRRKGAWGFDPLTRRQLENGEVAEPGLRRWIRNSED